MNFSKSQYLRTTTYIWISLEIKQLFMPLGDSATRESDGMSRESQKHSRYFTTVEMWKRSIRIGMSYDLDGTRFATFFPVRSRSYPNLSARRGVLKHCTPHPHPAVTSPRGIADQR
ncbi:unnamed protein product [Leptosia nina]|uniref:Uncharacterized protein n=1 Tax=Leptosia nina TaxID=320188 RepID=A0AAV1JIS1_9NEOP